MMIMISPRKASTERTRVVDSEPKLGFSMSLLFYEAGGKISAIGSSRRSTLYPRLCHRRASPVCDIGRLSPRSQEIPRLRDASRMKFFRYLALGAVATTLLSISLAVAQAPDKEDDLKNPVAGKPE